MKTRDFLWGLLACAAFSACSSDEVVENDVLTGGDSYVSIRLVTSNGDLDSRGSAGTPEFELGTEDEAKVTNAHFYFYDAAGNFEVEGETLSSSELFGQTLPSETTPGSNVETKGNVNIVLKEVTELPTSVLVVLNMDEHVADEMFKTNLSESYKALANTHTAWGFKSNDVYYFTMTNSSYMEGNSIIQATPVSTNHLQATEDLAKANPITIHVERMAAKVQLTTAAGVANASTTANAKLEDAEKTSKNIKIEVNAWGLNGVNNSSYYMKKIKPEWSYDWWNPNTESTKYYRSYWAEDPNYNDGSYPKNAANHNEKDDEGNQKVWSLNYFSTNEIMEAYSAGKPQYCLENTLGETILSNYMTHATHVILLATMKVDDSAIDLFNYKGVLYDLDNYKKVALSDFTASKSIYKKTTENENTVYTQISIEDIEINSLMDGKVNIKVKDANVQADTWYKGNTDGATAYTVDELNELFKDLNDAEGYKEGKMYYVIPIEHLASETVDKESLKVGDYGVVRNHYYTITVKSISNLGKGIYDPNEVIVPNFDPEKYYVAAQLNVLSWKTVQQEVEL